MVARERVDRRDFRNAAGQQGEKRAQTGTTGTPSSEHRVHLSGVEQPSGAAHIERRHVGHDP